MTSIPKDALRADSANPSPTRRRCDDRPTPNTVRQWAKIARGHASPQPARSALQLLTTVIPLAAIWATMMLTVEEAWWATLLLSVPAAAFTVRLFIIQHDCGHRSFFRSRRLNDMLGSLIGIVTLTPHDYWRASHNLHHSNCGNLQQRGIGDVTVLTVAEYIALPWWKRFGYRLYRHPAVLLVIGPVYVFVLKYRLPLDLIRRYPKLLFTVMGTKFGIAGAIMGLGLIFGFLDLLIVQTPIVLLSCAAGVWLFYVQHQFEHTHWTNESGWDFHESSVLGSSFYDLPQPLRFFSGNIGLHHVHHLSCRIPNYRLHACLADIPTLQSINRIRLRDSLNCLRRALWDEETQRLVTFRAARRPEAELLGMRPAKGKAKLRERKAEEAMRD